MKKVHLGGITIAILGLVACGGTTTLPPSPGSGSASEHGTDVAAAPDIRPPRTFATQTRPPSTPGERAAAAHGHVFDPALDCVARAIAERVRTETGDAAARHELPLRCGSPLYVIRVGEISDDAALAAEIAATDAEVPSPLRFAIGVAPAGASRVVVLARRSVELEPVTRDGREIELRGRALTLVPEGQVSVSSATGVSTAPLTFDAGRFAVRVTVPRDALVELTLRDNQGQTGPFARLELGNGSTLIPRAAPMLDAVNAARTKLGAAPVVASTRTDTACNPIPARVAGVDVSDRAKCVDVRLIGIDELAPEIAYRPELQSWLIDPTVSVIETSVSPSPHPTGRAGLSLRLLRRFEVLDPIAGRTRVLAMLKERWPSISVRPLANDGLANLVRAWSKDRDPYATYAAYKRRIDEIAAPWGKRTYNGVLAARDLHTAMNLLQPETSPIAADASLLQVRRPNGELIHLIVVVLQLP